MFLVSDVFMIPAAPCGSAGAVKKSPAGRKREFPGKCPDCKTVDEYTIFAARTDRMMHWERPGGQPRGMPADWYDTQVHLVMQPRYAQHRM